MQSTHHTFNWAIPSTGVGVFRRPFLLAH